MLGLVLFSAVEARVLVLGQVSDRPGKDYEQLRPMADYAAQQLAPLGISSAEVRLFPQAADLVAAMRRGEVDWVTETPFTAARLVHEAGARLLLRKWKRGQREYQSIIYTRLGSSVRSLDDLVGQTITFEHADSFSSYYLPRRLLEQRGMVLSPMKDLQQLPVPGRVSYMFSRNERNNALGAQVAHRCWCAE
jgi:phosphonate transport system substrate-binding protein